jgi:hypothetical protein
VANHCSLLLELASKIPENMWVDSPNVGGGSLRWAPLEQITESKMWIGLTPHGFWAIGRPSVSATSIEHEPSIAWLTLLELEHQEVVDKLRSISLRLGVKVKEDILASSLPIGDAIYMALIGKSPRWAEMALERLSDPHAEIGLEPRFIEPLKQIAESRVPSQRARHQAARLVRKSLGHARDVTGGGPSDELR